MARVSQRRGQSRGRADRRRSHLASVADELRHADWRGAVDAFRRHQLTTHAGAIAFRVLISTVPLVLLGLALLGVLGLTDVWTESLAPAVREKVTAPVFTAIDFSVDRILEEGSLGVIAFSSALLLWELYRAVRAITAALNVVHEVEEKRPWPRLVATGLGLALVVGFTLVGSILVVTVVPRVAGSGPVHVLATAAAWVLALVLLGLAAGVLLRYAPAERPQIGWASAGSVVIVATWVLASLAFGWWAFSVASYESAIGSLTVFLFLTFYVLVSSAIFLVGAELNEQARQVSGDER